MKTRLKLVDGKWHVLKHIKLWGLWHTYLEPVGVK